MGRVFVSKSAEVTTKAGSDDVFDSNPAGGLILWPASGLAMDLKSSDALDDSGATDTMQTGTIEGLDINFNPKKENFTMNGTTEVVVGIYAAINEFYATAWGTGDTTSLQNEGIVSLSGVASGDMHAEIIAERNRMRSSQYTVPAGKTLLVKSIAISDITGTINVTQMRLLYRPFGEINWFAVAGVDGETPVTTLSPQGGRSANFSDGIVIPPKSQTRLEVTSDAAGSAVGSWAGELIDGENDLLVTTAS